MSSAGAGDAVSGDVSVLYRLYLRRFMGGGGGRGSVESPPPPKKKRLHSDVQEKCKKITTRGVESAFVKNAQCVLYMNNVHDT